MSLKDKLPGRLGFGTAPLGNMFRNIPEEEAHGHRARGLGCGMRYFDTAPFYGAGLSEIRLGEALSRYTGATTTC
jgi:D-threo-aldose 1-dehydrogenase